MNEALKHYIGSARWFGGKGRGFTVGAIRRFDWLGDAPHVRIELVTIEYDDGDTEVYQVPLVYYPEAEDRLEHALIGEWVDDELGAVFVYDALHDRTATCCWLRAFDSSATVGELAFHRIEGYDLDLSAQGALFSGEQSNSSVAFGDDSLMKMFRKVTPGKNPDIEIHVALTQSGNTHVAGLYGWLEAPALASEEPLQLAMLSQFLRTASDGWVQALASVRDLFAEADLHADEVGGDFASDAHRLGIATGEVHAALAEEFPTKTWDTTRLSQLRTAMTARLDAAVQVAPALAEHADALREAYAGLAQIIEPIVVQRIHGDLHLGQTLRTVKGWKIVDFEGEPAKLLADRVGVDSVWRDVAGMLRSFDYAAHVVETDVQEPGPQIAYRALEWSQRNRKAFLEGYVEASTRTDGEHLRTDHRALLRAYEADKAVYETVYEARNRPDWIHIPLSAIARLVAHQDAIETDPEQEARHTS